MTDTVPESYTFALPAGWLHVPKGDYATWMERTLEAVPAPTQASDSWRAEVGTLFEEARAADHTQSVLDSYMTAGPLPGTSVAASMTISRVSMTVADGHSTSDILLARSLAAGAEVIEVARTAAVLVPLESAAPPVDRSARVLSSTGAFIEVPGHADFIIAIVFTVVSEHPEVLEELRHAERNVNEALLTLFRALLATFRWADADGRVLPSPEDIRG